jgi:Na+/proline symporter
MPVLTRDRLMTNTNIVLIALAPLLMYRIYKRVHRLTVRQKSRTWRHWCSVTLFPLVAAGIAIAVSTQPVALMALGGGVTAGALLGMLSLRRTGFERTGPDYFYTPYAPIGMVVSVLFIGRVMYRVFEMVTLGVQQTPNLGHSPLTLAIVGVMAGYYFSYGLGLLRWRSAERALENKA